MLVPEDHVCPSSLSPHPTHAPRFLPPSHSLPLSGSACLAPGLLDCLLLSVRLTFLPLEHGAANGRGSGQLLRSTLLDIEVIAILCRSLPICVALYRSAISGRNRRAQQNYPQYRFESSSSCAHTQKTDTVHVKITFMLAPFDASSRMRRMRRMRLLACRIHWSPALLVPLVRVSLC